MMVDQLLGPRMILDIYRGHFGLSLTRTKLGAKKLIRFFFSFLAKQKNKIGWWTKPKLVVLWNQIRKKKQRPCGPFCCLVPTHTHTPSNLVKVLLFWILSMFQTESTTSTKDKNIDFYSTTKLITKGAKKNGWDKIFYVWIIKQQSYYRIS